MIKTLERIPFIDHMRGFIFLLMAFDHSLHAYAANWGRFWFYRDYDRSYIFDALYLFNQSAIMPILFFTFGAMVLPKITSLGLKGFWKDRFVKHVIPFMVGVPLVVPLLSYPKFHEYDNPGPSFLDFWFDIFFSEKLQAGPYWVMYAIVMYTAVFLILNKIFPKLVPALGAAMKKALASPWKFCLLFILLSIFIYGASDLRWGAPWWIGLRNVLPDFLHGELFSLQASKFIMNFIYFIMGAAFMNSKAWEDIKAWKPLTNKRFVFLGATIIVGATYVLYAHFYFTDGAFNDTFYRTLRRGGETLDAWKDAFSILPDVAPAVLIRTSLLGLLAFLQTLTLIAFFSHQPAGSKWYGIWASAAACCWGIFILHDPVVIWGQYLLTDYSLPIFFKFAVIFIAGLSISWFLTKQLLKTPIIKSVFELD